MKQTFGAAFVALCLASCFSGVEEENAEVIESISAEEEQASADAENTSAATASAATASAEPLKIDRTFDTELRIGGDLLDLPQEKQFQPSSSVNSEDDDPTVITRPPSE